MDAAGGGHAPTISRRALSPAAALLYMHLHAKCLRRRPFLANRPDAWESRHRLFGAGARRHAAGIVGGARHHAPWRGSPDPFWGDPALHRVAADGVADEPDRTANAAHDHTRSARHGQSR